jgi:formimidoylglutamate deiminase
VLTLRDGVRAMGLPGVAIHSLRAATPASIHALVRRIEGDAAPVHLHIAEQTAEVDECLAATGARPIEWLLRELPIDERWQLVHATHATPAEIDAVAHRSAGVVLCPTTEANLGDGLCDLPRWLDSGAALSIGTDSHVGRTLNEELRWLDYGQRLHLRRRNIAARPGLADGATAAQLFDRALAGGAAAGGLARWGFVVGARADLVVLDDRASGLAGMPASHLLDGWVFVSAGASLRETWVAGHRRWSAADTITSVSTGFIAAMQGLAD